MKSETAPVHPAWRQAAVFLCGAAAALGVAMILDGPVVRYVASHPASWFDPDLYAMFRLAGFVPVWTVVAAAFALIDSREGWRAAWSRGGRLFTAVVVAGAATEVLKIIVRRERPHADLARYVFRPWHQDTFSSNLGWPSGHAAVAFAAVWVLCRLHPRATLVWLLIGGACAFSRLANNDHFVSDVVGGAVVAYAVVMLLFSRRGRSAIA